MMTREQPEGKHNWSKGVVHDIAYLGGHSVYHIRLPSGMIVQSSMANVVRTADKPTWEDEVFIQWDDDSGVVLNS